MSKAKTGRVDWNCPACGRTFRIPGTKPRPDVCPECTEKQTSSRKSTVSSARTSGPLNEIPGDEPRPEARPSRAKYDEYVKQKDQEQILDYLSNISRTMTFFRRLVWGLVFAMVLNVVVMGAGVLYVMKQFSSLQGDLGQGLQLPANAQVQPNGRGGLPAPADAIKQFGAYTDAVNDLVDEINNQ